MPQVENRSRMPQLKILHATTKIPRAATKTRCSQIDKYFKKKDRFNFRDFQMWCFNFVASILKYWRKFFNKGFPVH